MSDLIREIDEEVAKERAEQFWERWALPVGLFLLVFVGGLFIYFNWQARNQASALACADSFEAAVTALNNDPLSAEAQLAAISEGCGGYNQLAALKRADAQLAQGREAEAVASWQAFTEDTSHQENLRHLALAKIAWHGNGVIEGEDVETAISQLETLPAYEAYVPVLRAVNALEAKDIEKARNLLDSVLNAEESSPLVREYALSIASLMNDI